MTDATRSAVLTAAPTPNGRWLLAWAGERFPLRNAVFFALLYATVVAAVRAGGGREAFRWGDVPGFVALWAFFLLLRVCDEHKDFAADAVAHPGRVLQRGLVTLAELRALGAAAVALQFAVSVWHDGGVGAATAWWLAALGWSALMTREFFAPAWLRARTMVYALTHMLVMPLLVAWVAALAAPAATPAPAAAVASCAALAFAAGLAFEMARKLRAPSDEHPMADSYTSALGVPGAVRVSTGAVCAAGAAALLVVRVAAGTFGGWPVAVVAVGTLAAAAALHAFGRAPARGTMKRAEGAVAVALLTGHVVVLVAIAAARGGRTA